MKPLTKEEVERQMEESPKSQSIRLSRSTATTPFLDQISKMLYLPKSGKNAHGY
jgi:hypothetical protein